MQTTIILIITILANALANVFIKLGTKTLPALEPANLIQNLGKIVTNGWIMLGALLFVTNFPLYNLILQRMKLSIAFPLITSSAFAVAVVVSVFVFHEGLKVPHYAGLGLLVIAVWLLAR
ncbi:hypothetical protein HYW17_00295 [Candidatus Uhrbacteria bacterium]|nr:hypothetical protein [Candidatus Uhrbacteria bacterium]